jgi:hypothetical protein
LGVLLAVVLTALGASAGLQASTRALLQERAQRQRWEALQHLLNAVEMGPAVAQGWSSRPEQTLSDGSPYQLSVHRPASFGGDPAQGEHYSVSLRWTGPAGTEQVLTLRSFWHTAPRLP